MLFGRKVIEPILILFGSMSMCSGTWFLVRTFYGVCWRHMLVFKDTLICLGRFCIICLLPCCFVGKCVKCFRQCYKWVDSRHKKKYVSRYVQEKNTNFRLGIYMGSVILCECLFSTRQKLFFQKFMNSLANLQEERYTYIYVLLLESNAYLFCFSQSYYPPNVVVILYLLLGLCIGKLENT